MMLLIIPAPIFNIRILHSGSTAQSSGNFRNLGLQDSRVHVVPSAPKSEGSQQRRTSSS